MQNRNLAGVAAAAALALWAPALGAAAAAPPSAEAAVERLEHQWEHIKYQVPDSAQRREQIKALAQEAAAVGAQYPERPDVLIWQGIVRSEEAAMNRNLEALGAAKDARRLFERAYAMDRKALDAGAAASLGVLYYRVPGFPAAFGDKAKARRYLTEAVSLAPDSMDAQYFYGDFLAGQGEYGPAKKALEKALASPAHPDRPVWDAGRRAEIRALLTKVDSKLASAG